MDSKFLGLVKFFGFILDDKLLFLKQISWVISACYYMLLKIYSMRDRVDRDVLKLVGKSYDYFAAWLLQLTLKYGLRAVLHGKLQQMMNYACRLIFRLPPGTPSRFIKQLRWLPVQKRVLFRILLSGHRLIRHQRVPGHLGSLVSRNDKVNKVTVGLKPSNFCR